MLERLHPGEVLARLDDDFRNPDLASVLERLPKEDIGLIAAFLRLKVIRLVEIHRVDLLDIDEVLDIDRLRRFQVDPLKIFLAQDDKLQLFRP